MVSHLLAKARPQRAARSSTSHRNVRAGSMSASAPCGWPLARRNPSPPATRELCVVVLTGTVDVDIDGVKGSCCQPGHPRQRVRSGAAAALYVPAGQSVSITGATRCRSGAVFCTAPAASRIRCACSTRPACAAACAAKAATPACLRHPAARRPGRPPAGGGGDHAGGPLVELPAAQARQEQPPAETQLEETYYHRLNRRRVLPSSASTPTTAAWTRPAPSRTTTW
jgi:5-deoxy-glucuronate isomerase